MSQVCLLQVLSSRLWHRANRASHVKHSCLPPSSWKAVCSFVFDICTLYQHEEVRLEIVWLVPYGKRAHPTMPASCTPQATNTANKQVTPELLSTVLNPARATPQTHSTREWNALCWFEWKRVNFPHAVGNVWFLSLKRFFFGHCLDLVWEREGNTLEQA